jgi:Zinc-binding dehydrogenase
MGLKLRDILAQATRLVEAGELVPLIDPRRFSLASVESAYNALRDRDAQGKIIVDLPGTAHGETYRRSRRHQPVGDAASHMAAIGRFQPR